MTRVVRRTGVGVVVALAMTAAALVGTAGATPVVDPAAQAAALRQQVDRLQNQAEVAIERYDATESQLGVLVTERISAEEALAANQQAYSDQRSQLDAEVRALYMDGGQLGLVATVLSGSDLADVAARYQDMQSIVGASHTVSVHAAASVAATAASVHRLHTLTERQTRLETAAASAAASVQSLLARTQALLAAADAQVRRLAALQEAAAQAAGGRAFLDALAASRAGGPTVALAPNPFAAAAIAAARTKLGDPYVWGGSGPSDFDCSGLVQWSYAQAGLQLPRTAAEQYLTGPHPSLAQLQPGDLLFWATDLTDPTTIHHVAIYIGNGLMIAAPHTGTVVQVQPVFMDGFIGATRPLAGPGQ